MYWRDFTHSPCHEFFVHQGLWEGSMTLRMRFESLASSIPVSLQHTHTQTHTTRKEFFFFFFFFFYSSFSPFFTSRKVCCWKCQWRESYKRGLRICRQLIMKTPHRGSHHTEAAAVTEGDCNALTHTFKCAQLSFSEMMSASKAWSIHVIAPSLHLRAHRRLPPRPPPFRAPPTSALAFYRGKVPVINHSFFPIKQLFSSFLLFLSSSVLFLLLLLLLFFGSCRRPV